MADDSIKRAVDKFLGWPLPKDFAPDCGIAFDGRKNDGLNVNKTWPVGTNLFTADQARAMFEHCIGDVLRAKDEEIARLREQIMSPQMRCPQCDMLRLERGAAEQRAEEWKAAALKNHEIADGFRQRAERLAALLKQARDMWVDDGSGLAERIDAELKP